MKCLNCNCELTGSALKFCSVKCHTEYVWNQKKQAMLESGMVPSSGRFNETDRRLAHHLLEDIAGHNCAICGISEWQGKPLILVLDHIDGDPSNSQISNIRLICSNCDSQLKTYKNRRGVISTDTNGNTRSDRKREDYSRCLEKLGLERIHRVCMQSICPVCKKNFVKRKATQVCCSRQCADKLKKKSI